MTVGDIPPSSSESALFSHQGKPFSYWGEARNCRIRSAIHGRLLSCPVELCSYQRDLWTCQRELSSCQRELCSCQRELSSCQRELCSCRIHGYWANVE